ncbi:MAG: MBL fold metallo-hydrolase [Woeseia sp.]|jgi:ribonuclease Z|nr:MBL fold metallo-hydrolase [Woeseia sp.]
MRITMLGTSAAVPDPDRGGSGILLSVRDRHYLFDCGANTTRSMIKSHINPTQVDTVFLSHLHFDHIVDFPYFVLASWICDREKAPVVVGPPGTQNFVNHLFEGGAFAKDIEARVQYPRRQNTEVLKPDVRECEPGIVFEDEFVKVTACYVEHIPLEVSPCFGLRMDTVDGESVSFSGDTAPCDRFIEMSKDVDVMIHECTFPESAIEFRKKANIGTWAHTSPKQLGEIAKAANAKRLVATHFASYDTTNPVLRDIMSPHMPVEIMGPALLDEVAADIQRTYKGDLRLAHDQMRIDL